MALTEQQIYSALGLKGVQAQEPAAPATQSEPSAAEPATSGDGVQAQEPAAPAGAAAASTAEPQIDPTAEPSNEDPDGPTAAEGQQTGKEPLTVEQRRENAARRRREEQQTAIDNAVAAALQAEREKNDSQMAAFFKQAGLKNNITGEPITNMEQFQVWQNAHSAAKLERNLKAGKLTPEDLQKVVSEHPAIKAAEELINRTQNQQKQEQEARDRARIDSDIAEIQKLDPTIRSVSDLINAPNSQEIYRHVKNGMSFLEAFKLANFDRLTTQKAQAAQQQAMNNARGKDHLNGGSNSRGAGMATVSTEQMRMYKLFNPSATEAQIQAHFNKHKKNS